MALRDLLTDRDIISGNIAGEERTLAENFIARRVRLFIGANPPFNNPQRPGDLTDIATKGVALALIKEVPDRKIVGIQPVSVGPGNIAAWTRFADLDANVANVPVVRPKV